MIPELSDMTKRIFLGLFATLLIAGCQPSPQERFSRAEQHFAAADYRATIIELKNAIRGDANYADARFLMARSAYQLADFATSESEYIRALELGLDREDVWLGYGRVLLAQGKAAVALERVVPNLDSETDSITTLVFLGDVFSTLRNLDEAEAYYQHALQLDSSAPRALVGRAVIAAARGDSTQALQLLDDATKLQPDSARVWRALGNFQRIQRNYPSAADAYAQSIEVETAETPLDQQFRTRANRVSVLLDSLQYDAAKLQLDELIRTMPGHPLLHYLKGRLAYGMRDLDTAQTELQEYVSLIPRDLRGQAILGAVNFSQNYLNQAEMYLLRAAQGNVGGDITRRLLAETQLRLRKPGAALQSLQLAEATGISDPALLAMLGRAEIGLGNVDAAIAYFEQSVAADPDNPAASLSLATGLIAAGRYEEAVEILDSAPDSDDSQYRREILLMAAYMQNGKQEDAFAEAAKLVEQNPDDPAVHAIAGALRRSAGEPLEALPYFESALALDPNNRAALYGLGQIAMERSELADAEIWFARLLDFDAAFVPALVFYSRLLTVAGRYSELGPRFDAAIAADPQSLFPRLLHARVAVANNAYDETLEIVAAAREFHPDDSKLQHVEGLALIATGQSELGLRNLTSAASSNPDDPTMQYDLAAALMGVADYQDALTAVLRFREMRPEDVRGLAVQVEALSRSNRLADARTVVHEFRQGSPGNLFVIVRAGDIEMLDGKPEQALVHYQAAAEVQVTRTVVMRLAMTYQATEPAKALVPLKQWLDEHPDDAEIRRAYAQTLEAQGDKQAAVVEYERLLNDGGEDPVSLNNLAWQYAEEGREGAVALAERAHELAPDNGSISDTLGWILYRDGQADEALEILRLAATQSPNNPEVQFHLATVLVETGNREEASSVLDALLKDNDAFSSRQKAQQLADTL